MTDTALITNGRPREAVARTPLMRRRLATLGSRSPLFYAEPLELVRGEKSWVIDSAGKRYLDAYNNVPHIGHSHPRVREAVCDALSQININSRYLTEQPIAYAERLLATFEPGLERVMFVNSGSEANELALRIARQHARGNGVLISDFSYHGNTTMLAQLTTGLTVREPLGEHVRAITIPDVPQGAGQAEISAIVSSALAEADEALASLAASGHRVSAVLLDASFSTEGLPRVPAAYLQGLADRVRSEGGLYIADEVQSGFGRLGSWMWGYQKYGLVPDLVTLGKPMGNGLPIGAVVLPSALGDEFSSRNQYFNTFATTAVPTAAAAAVLDEMDDAGLMSKAKATGEYLRAKLAALAPGLPQIADLRGDGLYLGIELTGDDGRPAAQTAGWLTEELRECGVLGARIGRYDNVMKVRPPLAFGRSDADVFAAAFADGLTAVLASATGGC